MVKKHQQPREEENDGNDGQDEGGPNVKAQASGFFGRLFGPFVGAFKGFWGATGGNLMGLGMATLGLFGLQKVAPDAVVKIPGGIGEKLAHDAHEDGSRGELINGFLGSVIGLGAFGTVKGIATGGMTPDDQEPTLGGKIGGTIGTVGAFGLLAAAVVGAVQHGKIGFAGTSDAGTKQPGATPGKPGDNSNSLNKTA